MFTGYIYICTHIINMSLLITYMYMYTCIVSGEANFIMTSTMLTIGGFTQPVLARSLIELPANSEKGLSSRFLWFFPNPLYGKFENLGKVDENFVAKISKQ